MLLGIPGEIRKMGLGLLEAIANIERVKIAPNSYLPTSHHLPAVYKWQQSAVRNIGLLRDVTSPGKHMEGDDMSGQTYIHWSCSDVEVTRIYRFEMTIQHSVL